LHILLIYIILPAKFVKIIGQLIGVGMENALLDYFLIRLRDVVRDKELAKLSGAVLGDLQLRD